jgi:hypothetical protein
VLPRKIVGTLGTIKVLLPSYPVNKCILTIQTNWQHRIHKTKTNKTKTPHNICLKSKNMHVCCFTSEFQHNKMNARQSIYKIFFFQVYAWIAVFVLPLNSAINPVLYTISTATFLGNVRKRACRFRKSFTGSYRSTADTKHSIVGRW